MDLTEFTLQGHIQVMFSGPKPNHPNLGGYKWDTLLNKNIQTMLQRIIVKLVTSPKYKKIDFICGGGLGIDQMAFAICYALRQTGQYEKMGSISQALTYEDFYSGWFGEEDKSRHLRHKEKADDCAVVDTLSDYQVANATVNTFNPQKITQHIQYMVDHSDLAIVVWDGATQDEKGWTTPTYTCITALRHSNKPFIILNPKDYTTSFENKGVVVPLPV